MKTKNPKRGRKASNVGNHEEANIKAILLGYVNEEVHYKAYKEEMTSVLVPQFWYPHPSNKKGEGKADFFVVGRTEKRVFIQVKAQTSGGSVDAKLDHETNNALYAWGKLQYDRFVLLLTGPYWDSVPKLVAWKKDILPREWKLRFDKMGLDVEMDLIKGPDELTETCRRYRKEGIL